jgi:predicted alpha/beta-hydrolase family hydrolase
MTPTPLSIAVNEATQVSGLFLSPRDAIACYVFAHGAGAGMAHPSMTQIADELASLGIATLRYQFPYMEKGSKRPDAPALCHATVRAVVAEAARVAPGVPLFAGGKSFGGRMTSQAQALSPLPNVRGLVFMAFPLHPAKRPADERAAHLDEVRIPMLFLQGTRDELAYLELLEPVVQRLGARATLHLARDADHSFHVPARTGRKDPEVRAELLAFMRDWLQTVLNSE